MKSIHMSRKPICAIALAASLMLAGPTAAAEDTHLAAVKDLLVLLKAKERMQLAVSQIVALQVRRDPRLGQFKPELEAFVGKYLAWESLEPELIARYKKTFTEQELRDIVTFFRSPAGQKARAHIEPTLRDVAQGRNAQMQENAIELRAAMQKAQRRLGGVVTPKPQKGQPTLAPAQSDESQQSQPKSE
ncbi:MAG: DUF2059 domain-containing protein [Pseudomonadota bacterium]